MERKRLLCWGRVGMCGAMQAMSALLAACADKLQVSVTEQK
jgi:hypothetical protein